MARHRILRVIDGKVVVDFTEAEKRRRERREIKDKHKNQQQTRNEKFDF